MRHIAMGMITLGGYTVYRSVISHMQAENNSLFISERELEDILENREVEKSGVKMKKCRYMNHLDSRKQTVLVQADGISGVILSSVLSRSSKFNIVLVSAQENLSRSSTGIIPVFDKWMGVYDNSWRARDIFSDDGMCYSLNKAFSRDSYSHNEIDSIVLKNAGLIEKSVEAKDRYRMKMGVAGGEDLEVGIVEKRKVIEKLVGELVFKEKPDLVMNGVDVRRLLYRQEKRDEVVGVLTSEGVILCDYFVLSTEERSRERLKLFGLDLPILDKEYYYYRLPQGEARRDQVDLKEKVLTLNNTVMTGEKMDGFTGMFKQEITSDRFPIVGRVNGRSNCFLNLAYGGNTFNLAFATAECLKKDMETGEKCNLFDPNRFYSLSG